ncbi:hypothetical protein IB211_01355 [Intestinimonas butyriciproducens]|uniref:Uncharacterized protein n=1 Tax=Intestinimonas butyriciproducens TaxID=1297617 RepID=A0A0S2W308_9FIRM|nr:hypothetical protein IB211_01355 [Intestinimonas butyriciproducens]
MSGAESDTKLHEDAPFLCSVAIIAGAQKKVKTPMQEKFVIH